MKKQFTACVGITLASLILVLQGCSSTSTSKKQSAADYGNASPAMSAAEISASSASAASLKFPDINDAWRSEGTFPEAESIRLLGLGMNKDQLYDLIGSPHFSEGVGASKWNYIFNFRTPNGVVTCQYLITFNDQKRVSGLYWKDQICEDFIKIKPASL